MKLSGSLCVVTSVVVFAVICESSPDAQKLYTYLMRDYNKLIRPVEQSRDTLVYRLGLKLTQLIGVDEVNQVITTNVVLTQTWNDYKLKWNPAEFGGIEKMDVASDSIWVPDLVLYNNADGNYHITSLAKATVNYTGDVTWAPPAIFKSSCAINVTYFPYKWTKELEERDPLLDALEMHAGATSFWLLISDFDGAWKNNLWLDFIQDKQECELKFSSWTYDSAMVELVPVRGFSENDKRIVVGMDLSDYKESIEWEILEASAVRSPEVYPYGTWMYIRYQLVIRRKTLFYTVNLIIPCVLISLLTVFVFYLPSDSGEKVTLCISILLSLTVFILLLAEIIPPTSLTVPLIGRYLLFTLIMVTCSIAVTIVVINVHFRNPSTHVMRPWVRRVFTQILPKLLLLERPKSHAHDDEDVAGDAVHGVGEHPYDRSAFALDSRDGFASPRNPRAMKLRREVQETVGGINFIVDHMRETNKFANTVKDWKYMAMVLDRLFLWIFAIACIVGTGKIILDAPPLYENTTSIPVSCANTLVPTDEWMCLYMDEDRD